MLTLVDTLMSGDLLSLYSLLMVSSGEGDNMKALTAIAYTLMTVWVLAMLALMPGATTAAEPGDSIELGFVEVHVEFGSGIVGPDGTGPQSIAPTASKPARPAGPHHASTWSAASPPPRR